MDVIHRAAEFHGHLGPFLVIGVRMSLLAKRALKSKGFKTSMSLLTLGTLLLYLVWSMEYRWRQDVPWERATYL